MFYPSHCQFFIAFNITIVFLPAHRFLIKRCDVNQNNMLIQWMTNYDHIITVAAGILDREYIYYYTGKIVPVIYSSSLFTYPQPQQYNPIFPEILVAPFKLKAVRFKNELNKACHNNNANFTFTTIYEKLGSNWKYEELYNFKAVIVFPYALLSYYINDIMASCLPLFVPSPTFLLQLGLVGDYRNSDPYYCKSSFIEPQPNNTKHPYSPEDGSPEARLYWYQFASFYTPATIQFDSWDDLIYKLKNEDLDKWFLKRKKENIERKCHNEKEWKSLFQSVHKRELSKSYAESLRYFNVSSFF